MNKYFDHSDIVFFKTVGVLGIATTLFVIFFI